MYQQHVCMVCGTYFCNVVEEKDVDLLMYFLYDIWTKKLK
jgi:hypothetical protein